MFLPIIISLLPVLAVSIAVERVGTAWEVSSDKNALKANRHWPSAGSSHESVFETRTVVGHSNVKPNREKRSPTYHVLESPGLKSHFEIQPELHENHATVRIKKIAKRSIDKIDFDNTDEANIEEQRIQIDRNIVKRSLNPGSTVETSESSKVKPAINEVQYKKRSVESMDESSKQPFHSDNIALSSVPNAKYSQMDESKNEALPDKQYREARGATKEQWIKQPYPVEFQSHKDIDNDQRTSGSNNDDLNLRAPRVHFVTQKRLDAAETRDRSEVVVQRLSPTTSPRGAGRAYEPQAEAPRARSLDSYDFRVRSYDSTPRTREYRDYSSGREYNRYDTDTAPHYISRQSDYDLNYIPSPSQKKQQRIIYYATLPDVVRSPPHVDLRYRSPDSHLPPLPPPEYYKRYDDRHVTSPTVSVADNGRYYQREGGYDTPPTYTPQYYRRNSAPVYYGEYHSTKAGYDDRPLYRHDGVGSIPMRAPLRPTVQEEYRGGSQSHSANEKDRVSSHANDRHQSEQSSALSERAAPYHPVKISTSVNVKENERKVPERRIYADRDREYVYAPPSFQTADDDTVGYEARY